jgi:glutamine synthetase
MILNAIASESFTAFAQEIERAVSAGVQVEEAWRSVVRANIKKHRRIFFDGNGYTKEWEEEAAQRGLPNYRATPDVLSVVYSQKNIDLFSKHEILDADELRAHVVIGAARYCHSLMLEAKAIRVLTDQQIIPAVVRYLSSLLALGEHAPRGRVNEISKLINESINLSSELSQLAGQLHDMTDSGQHDSLENDLEAAKFAKDSVLPMINKLREKLDALEMITDRSIWPVASYQDILQSTHN